MSVEKEQRDILFEACRHIATNKRTPEWIAGYLTQAVMKAKAVVNTDFPESLDAPTEVKQQPPDPELVSLLSGPCVVESQVPLS